MVEERTIVKSGLAAGAVGLAGVAASGTVTAQSDESLLVDGFASWDGENDLNEYSSAGSVANGDGSGELVDGALRLEYDGGGWFLSNVRQDVSDYTHLELVVRGDDVEEDGIQLEVGGVEGMLSELTDDSIETAFTTVSVDLVDVGVDRSSVDDIWLNFWQADDGAIEIDEIRFVDAGTGAGPPAIDGTQPADTTGDGLYNDLTGSGSTTTTDVNVFFENVDNPDVADYPQYYDFDGNGQVSVTDVVELFESI
ncbi:hypothetical protein OB955_08260 [Halobacteria archaeon AArc-m2/3/4]|uniref:EF-hand domain-containing protein n=1 Tax=Natronoglomus mannanivorans TaxID=2979990 RepID=A0ABT2QCT7_9EURY|nr:hypothetical protein [Halobacteria archaeon AArc-m2/3/4]